MAVVHILNQYVWPDGAPTGVYAEQLAVALHSAGNSVQLVGGSGRYRASARPEPPVPRVIVPHWKGQRGNHISTLREYFSVRESFGTYIKNEVRRGDIVIISSAPPTTLALWSVIRETGATSIYWLQDYYPELIRGVWDYPSPVRRAWDAWWHRLLAKWDHVVKVAGNIRGDGANTQVIRNWPTLKFPAILMKPESKTALYTGNLGYGHHLPSFIEKCRQLLDDGIDLGIHADGPGAAQISSSLPCRKPFASEAELSQALQRAETHLVAGHPDIQHAVFPSKIWNSLGLGRSIVSTGFAGAMLDELHFIQTHMENPRQQWCDIVASIAKKS